jgi:peptidoglycan/LPS O-acetylase OafA/YrhL
MMARDPRELSVERLVRDFMGWRAPMRYRADIDGLRAIAVLAVVSFHLKFGLSGGFVGVDIFFVISGYLIAGIIHAEIAAGSFSLLTFYARRARRILPALVSTILVSSIAALMILHPSALVAFSKSAIASVLFSANFYFLATSDYFAPAANTIPLLHLWSLGIEEQFYILFPALALACTKYARKLLPAVLFALCVASLAASQILLGKDPLSAFYLLPYRGFELLIGCLISLPAARAIPRSALAAQAAAFAGAAVLMFCAAFLGPATQYPGFAAALPSVGTALIISAAEARPTFISNLLSTRLLVSIGRISYSLYLVHWPVIVFGLKLFPNVAPAAFGLFAVAISFLLGLLNYRFVERPFRQSTRRASSLRALGVSAAAVTCLCGLSAWTLHENGFSSSTDERIDRVLSYLDYDHDRLYLDRECYLSPDQDFSLEAMSGCLPRGPGSSAILWGDSHAMHLYPGLRPTLEKEGYALGVLTASACAPIIGYQTAVRPKCTSFNEHALEAIRSLNPKLVILSARWPTDDPSVTLLDRTVDSLAKLGIKVVILGESPLYKIDVPLIVAKRLESKDSSRAANGELDLELGFLRWSDRILSARFGNRSDVRFISVMRAICPKDDCPLTTPDGTPVHFDTAHLTEEGSRLFAELLTPMILH